MARCKNVRRGGKLRGVPLAKRLKRKSKEAVKSTGEEEAEELEDRQSAVNSVTGEDSNLEDESEGSEDRQSAVSGFTEEDLDLEDKAEELEDRQSAVNSVTGEDSNLEDESEGSEDRQSAVSGVTGEDLDLKDKAEGSEDRESAVSGVTGEDSDLEDESEGSEERQSAVSDVTGDESDLEDEVEGSEDREFAESDVISEFIQGDGETPERNPPNPLRISGRVSREEPGEHDSLTSDPNWTIGREDECTDSNSSDGEIPPISDRALRIREQTEGIDGDGASDEESQSSSSAVDAEDEVEPIEDNRPTPLKPLNNLWEIKRITGIRHSKRGVEYLSNYAFDNSSKWVSEGPELISEDIILKKFKKGHKNQFVYSERLKRWARDDECTDVLEMERRAASEPDVDYSKPFAVRRIRGKRYVHGREQFLLLWIYDRRATWEPKKNAVNVDDCMEKFLQKNNEYTYDSKLHKWTDGFDGAFSQDSYDGDDCGACPDSAPVRRTLVCPDFCSSEYMRNVNMNDGEQLTTPYPLPDSSLTPVIAGGAQSERVDCNTHSSAPPLSPNLLIACGAQSERIDCNTHSSAPPLSPNLLIAGGAQSERIDCNTHSGLPPPCPTPLIASGPQSGRVDCNTQSKAPPLRAYLPYQPKKVEAWLARSEQMSPSQDYQPSYAGSNVDSLISIPPLMPPSWRKLNHFCRYQEDPRRKAGSLRDVSSNMSLASLPHRRTPSENEIHPNLPRWACPICESTFAKAAFLNRHLKKTCGAQMKEKMLSNFANENCTKN